MFMPSLQALIGTTFLIVLWRGGWQLLHGQISLGGLISFNAYLVQLVWPMIALGWVTNIFQRGAASMGRLNYILEAQPSIENVVQPPHELHSRSAAVHRRPRRESSRADGA